MIHDDDDDDDNAAVGAEEYPLDWGGYRGPHGGE